MKATQYITILWNACMFGYEEVSGQCFKIADAEKALLDYFYVTVFIKKAKPRLTEIDLEDLNPDKFLSYGKRMGKKMFAFLKETGLADSSRWNDFVVWLGRSLRSGCRREDWYIINENIAKWCKITVGN